MPAPANRQRGVVLIIALVMLLVLTLLATTSMRESTLQARISGSVAEQKLASNAAESGLREAERRLAGYSELDEGAATCSASVAAHSSLCILNQDLGAHFFAYASNASGTLKNWWTSASYAIDYSGTDESSSFASSPRWNLAYYGFDPGNEVTNVEESAYGVGPHYYVATSAGQAGGERMTPVLQSVTIRRF
ncbi:MAG: pilus assembly PilX family protein [Pseudomonas sp.]